uniref:Reverse transcriptase domain-containing protein n=1 Tax=Octopus bimaculoides TaxID=37653 RepID=A0A0L8I069_OCTBM
MEKAFDRVPRSFIWLSMRNLGIGEWLVKAVQAMYRDAVILQAITEEFKTGCTWKFLYTDDLALVAESLSELEEKFQNCKKGVGRNSIRCTHCKPWTHNRCKHLQNDFLK